MKVGQLFNLSNPSLQTIGWKTSMLKWRLAMQISYFYKVDLSMKTSLSPNSKFHLHNLEMKSKILDMRTAVKNTPNLSLIASMKKWFRKKMRIKNKMSPIVRLSLTVFVNTTLVMISPVNLNPLKKKLRKKSNLNLIKWENGSSTTKQNQNTISKLNILLYACFKKLCLYQWEMWQMKLQMI